MIDRALCFMFESLVNLYMSQTFNKFIIENGGFESLVNLYMSQTVS